MRLEGLGYGIEGTISPISERKVSESQTNDSKNFDFPFEVKESFCQVGNTRVKTGSWSVVRTDLAEPIVIGGYQKKTSVLAHVDLSRAFEEALESKGLEYVRTVTLLKNGGRAVFTYTLNSVEMAGPAGEVYNPVFVLKNSLDGKWLVSGSWRVSRLICLNGCSTTIDELILSKKHSANLDLSKVVQLLESGLEKSHDSLESFKPMAEIELSTQQVFNILSNMQSVTNFGAWNKKAGLYIFDAWQNPTSDEEPLGDNLYRLMQSGTRVFRDLDSVAFESADGSRNRFCQVLQLAANPKISSFARGAFDAIVKEPKEKDSLAFRSERQKKETETIEV